MMHIRGISRQPQMAQSGLLDSGMTPLETLIIFVLTAAFQDWDNFPSVIQNLQKFYQKT